MSSVRHIQQPSMRPSPVYCPCYPSYPSIQSYPLQLPLLHKWPQAQHSAGGSPSPPCHKLLPSLRHGYSTAGAACWEVMHGNNGFSLDTAHCRLCHAKTRPDLGWTKTRKRQNILPRVHSTLLPHLWTRSVPILEETHEHKNVFVVWLKQMFSTTSCKEDWDRGMLLQKTKQRMGQLLVMLFPSLLNSSVKTGFYATDWERQERGL